MKVSIVSIFELWMMRLLTPGWSDTPCMVKEYPHGFDHVVRNTGNFGPEFYFSKDVFHLFSF